MAKNNGGTAFPHKNSQTDSRGMNLRDYFAIHATHEDIARYLSDAPLRINTAEEMQTRAAARYAFADAMLVARQS